MSRNPVVYPDTHAEDVSRQEALSLAGDDVAFAYCLESWLLRNLMEERPTLHAARIIAGAIIGANAEYAKYLAAKNELPPF